MSAGVSFIITVYFERQTKNSKKKPFKFLTFLYIIVLLRVSVSLLF